MTVAKPVLTDAQAKLEAARCLMCDDPPCVTACPAQVPVKHFIRAIRFDSPRRAINLIRDRNVFAGVCGLACRVDELCVGACANTELSTPIAIGQLQHYAAVTAIRAGRLGRPGPANGEKVDAGARIPSRTQTSGNPFPQPDPSTVNVAVIGAGPSGLAAAAQLAHCGHQPVVFEKNKRPGGICTYGVPIHRVPQDLVAAEIEYVRSLGVEIRTSSPFGRGTTLDDLFADGFKAVYLATGAQRALTTNIPGESLVGVTTWKNLLDHFSHYNLGEGKRPDVPRGVIVVGGGSVAMDTASTAGRLGAKEIDLVCLEAPREMPAYHDELKEVWDAGARFHTRSMPIEITGHHGRVTGLKAVRIRWKQPDKFVPENAERIAGTGYWLPGEMVIFAIGAKPARRLADALPGVKLDDAGRVIVDPETGATSRPGVFAGGDVASDGGTTIVKSVAEGKRAAQAIDAYLRGR